MDVVGVDVGGTTVVAGLVTAEGRVLRTRRVDTPGGAGAVLRTVAALVEQVIGWLLAGAAMAWWIGRRERKPA